MPIAFPMKNTSIIGTPARHFAGFWKRFAAMIIDGVVLLCVFALCRMGGADPIAMIDRPDASVAELVIALAVPLATCWSYWSGFECSPLQATPGKLAVGIYVTGIRNERLDFTSASARFFGKLLSALSLGLGFIMAGTTQNHQALHDRICGCLVLSR